MPETAAQRLDQVLDRVRATEPLVHAYTHVAEDLARKLARRADATVPKSPIHGVPFAVKEVIDVAGLPVAGGSPALSVRIAETNASVVQRLLDAGAVLVGMQVSHELTVGLDTPSTRNPWDLACYPGGSSAGAGVSVAIGSAGFALGTDAAGSVRIPAAMTGVVGLKPTAGLVSSHGVLRQASAPSIDHVGVVAGTVAAVRDVLDVIAWPDPADARTLIDVAQSPAETSNDAPLDGRRIAVLGESTRASLNALAELDPEIDAAFTAACQQIESAGAVLVPIELPTLSEASAAIVTLFSTELAMAHRDLSAMRPSDYHPDILAMIIGALETPASTIAEAVGVRGRLRAEIRQVFDAANTDLLMTPTTPRVAMPLETFEPSTELGTLIPFTCGFNLTGQPAVSVPCGSTRAGLPIGLQFVGQAYADHLVLLVAETYEQMNDWWRQRPVIAA